MNNNIIVIRKKSRPYKYVTWDRITMIFKPNYNNIFHPTDINIEKCEVILSQGRVMYTRNTENGGVLHYFHTHVQPPGSPPLTIARTCFTIFQVLIYIS